jgi:hypothetical protein
MDLVSGRKFSKTLSNQATGAIINYACKFAFTGGLAVTKYLSYKVGKACEDVVAPTDIDGDGVYDSDDLCSNTPTNTIVNSDGCALNFELPSNNFTIKTTGESCIAAENGSIEISANKSYNYKATLNGAIDMYQGTKFVFENLRAGSYDLCIEVMGTDFGQCYTIEVDEAVAVSAKASNSMKYTTIEMLEGTAPYTIVVNGKSILTTNKKTFTIPTRHGDQIDVETGASCEGIYHKQVNLYSQIRMFPNPTNGKVIISVPNSEKSIFLEVYNTFSQVLISKNFNVSNQSIQLELQDKPMGVYYIKLYLEEPVLLKIIKK